MPPTFFVSVLCQAEKRSLDFGQLAHQTDHRTNSTRVIQLCLGHQFATSADANAKEATGTWSGAKGVPGGCSLHFQGDDGFQLIASFDPSVADLNPTIMIPIEFILYHSCFIYIYIYIL